MRTNAELKMEAKEMLQGRWKESILMCLIPTLLAIVIGILFFFLVAMPGILFLDAYAPTFFDSTTTTTNFNIGDYSDNAISGLITSFFTVGIGWTFLEILRGEAVMIEPFKDATRGFRSPYGLAILVIYILTSIFTFLWTLLFIIPGIVKSYSYSQTYNIYYDTYEKTGEKPSYLNAVTASRRLMDGYKSQLFLLDLSFIGWHILALLTFGIGYLWLNPYIYATKAAFYNHLPK
ncbi:DUF975 family protein [Enterococcus olivae]